MQGTIEQKNATPEKIKGPTESKMPVRPIVLVVIAVVVILIIAFAAYALMRNAKENEGLKASVSPESLTVNAGVNATLDATATWNGDSIDDSPNATFKWSVSNGTLGTFSSDSKRNTTYHAGKVGGSGTISCNVTYVSEDGTSSVKVDVSLVVNAPTLAAVKVSPAGTTLVFDRAAIFNVTAENSVGDEILNIPDADIGWTVFGLPDANFTLNSTHGASVNLTANKTGTILLNVTVTVNGVEKSVSITVHVLRAAPTMILTDSKLPAGAGINWTFTEPTEALDWDQITLRLTDGTSTVNWSLTMMGLDSGTYNMSEFGPRTLGALTVFLNVTDVDGNGAVNSTDFFLFTTSGGKFLASGNYVLTIVYEPTAIDDVAQMTFKG